jgi:hypothetical protein
MVEAIFYMLRTAGGLAVFAALLWAMEVGLHTVATLVRSSVFGRNRPPAEQMSHWASTPCR